MLSYALHNPICVVCAYPFSPWQSVEHLAAVVVAVVLVQVGGVAASGPHSLGLAAGLASVLIQAGGPGP